MLAPQQQDRALLVEPQFVLLMMDHQALAEIVRAGRRGDHGHAVADFVDGAVYAVDAGAARVVGAGEVAGGGRKLGNGRFAGEGLAGLGARGQAAGHAEAVATRRVAGFQAAEMHADAGGQLHAAGGWQAHHAF
nr:hypothetical protein [Pseudothauera nasutitermitis]